MARAELLHDADGHDRNRLIVEIHHYDPYDFTLNPSGPCLAWGAPFPQYSQCAWAQEAYHTDLFAQVRNKWVANGIPVIIGEYGVGAPLGPEPGVARSSTSSSSRVPRSTNGIKTFYWDNGVVRRAATCFALFEPQHGRDRRSRRR